MIVETAILPKENTITEELKAAVEKTLAKEKPGTTLKMALLGAWAFLVGVYEEGMRPESANIISGDVNLDADKETATPIHVELSRTNANSLQMIVTSGSLKTIYTAVPYIKNNMMDMQIDRIGQDISNDDTLTQLVTDATRKAEEKYHLELAQKANPTSNVKDKPEQTAADIRAVSDAAVKQFLIDESNK